MQHSILPIKQAVKYRRQEIEKTVLKSDSRDFISQGVIVRTVLLYGSGINLQMASRYFSMASSVLLSCKNIFVASANQVHTSHSMSLPWQHSILFTTDARWLKNCLYALNQPEIDLMCTFLYQNTMDKSSNQYF